MRVRRPRGDPPGALEEFGAGVVGEVGVRGQAVGHERAVGGERGEELGERDAVRGTVQDDQEGVAEGDPSGEGDAQVGSRASDGREPLDPAGLVDHPGESPAGQARVLTTSSAPPTRHRSPSTAALTS